MWIYLYIVSAMYVCWK